MKEAFLQLCKRVHPMKEAEVEALAALFEPVQLRPREHLFKEGQYTDKLYFIEKGYLRSYCIKDGEELTINFYFGPTLYAELAAMLENRPTIFNLQCLEDTCIYQVQKSKLDGFAEEYPVILPFMLRFFEIIYSFGLKRQLSFIYHSAEERYLNLFNERPKVISEIPLTHIASYLGIKPESLSRIRRKYQERMKTSSGKGG